MDNIYRGKFKSLFLVVFLLFCFIVFSKPAIAMFGFPSYITRLTLENLPKIGEIGIVKLQIEATFDNEKVEIGCFLPEGLRLIQDSGSKIISSQRIVSPKNGQRIIFYSGPMKDGEKKEFIFKVIIPDGRRYTIGAGSVGEGDYLEIDLGEPQPPEWDAADIEDMYKTRSEGKIYIKTGIKQIESGKAVDLKIPQDALPPLRTELEIRTRYKPYVHMPYDPQQIPLRYLIYSEAEAKDVEITARLPEGLELIDAQNYQTDIEEKDGQRFTKIKLFQGPMRFKQCQAFYLNLRSDKEECFRVRVEARMLTDDNKEFIREDFQDIELGKVIY